MLDKLPAWVRHLAIIIGTAALGAVAQSLASGEFDVATVGAAALTAVLAQLSLWLTALTRQYGVGAADPPAEPVIE
jgi:hypothetical protein